MIKNVSDIAEKGFKKINILNGAKKIQDIFSEEEIECFCAYDHDELVGVVTKKELVVAHPNRIVADIMSDRYRCIDSATPIWKVKEIFDTYKNIEIILLEDQGELVGYVTRTILNMELNKSIDLLTGLYRSDYIFYNAYNLLKEAQEVSVIFMDVDNFGCIDKQYGHIIGDDILRSIARILKENTDQKSFLCRYAGDEFAIVAPYSMEHSERIAKNIIKAIHSYTFPKDIQVSVSIGISGYTLDKDNSLNTLKPIMNMINDASLLSTKAKEKECSAIITNMGVIA